MINQKLKSKLLSTGYFIDNNFLNDYIDLMMNDTINNGYSEYHHILQKQYFRLINKPIDSSAENLKLLSYADHCKAHWLLYYCTIGKLKRANAASVTYILKVYNNLNKTLKTKDELSGEIFLELQKYYDDIRNDQDSKYYTDYEIKFIKENYPTYGARYCSNKLKRSIGSIQNEANVLGLTRNWTWTEEMNTFLFKNYTKIGGRACANKLGLSQKLIYKQAKKLGLSRYGKRRVINSWSQEEDAILIKYYPAEGTQVYKRLKGRSFNACRQRALILGLSRKHIRPNSWTLTEINILKTNINKPVKEIALLLPSRTEASIRHYIKRHIEGDK